MTEWSLGSGRRWCKQEFQKRKGKILLTFLLCENSLDIWCIVARNCCNSITLQLILFTNLDCVAEKSNWCNVNHLLLVHWWHQWLNANLWSPYVIGRPYIFSCCLWPPYVIGGHYIFALWFCTDSVMLTVSSSAFYLKMRVLLQMIYSRMFHVTFVTWD